MACLNGLRVSALALTLAACSQGEGERETATTAASPPAVAEQAPAQGYPTRVYFGDTHLHTAMSMDAGAFGNRLGIEDAYRFARGEEVMASSGHKAKLSRPLDFLVVADHSDGMGFFPDLYAGKPELLADPTGKKWYDMIKGGQGNAAALDIIDQFSRGTFPEALMYSPGTPAYGAAWKATIDGAEKYNEPGKFTAFIGYEWTSQVPPGNNLHRVVIFRDNGDKAGQVEPFTTYPPAGSTTPEDLWKVLQAYQDKTGGQVLAIAHNGNLSNGMMFPWDVNPASKQPLTKEYAQTRIRWEPLYEATQMKGDGESHPALSTNDEMSGFEIWDKGNLNLSEAKKPAMLQGEYVRTALQTGLQLEQKLGVNPYKFGLIGSTDSHTSLSTADDNNFWGKTTPSEPAPKRFEHPFMKTAVATIPGWEQTASGYAAVWATENTRTALWDAMKRKETYATTGPRMTVRFFGGWDFADTDVKADLVKAGYERGVPMGGDLKAMQAGQSPTFLVAAMKDPEGGNLDRVQIVKGWIDATGARQEKVYDVAWSGDRKPGADGKLPAVGNTVDLKTATYSNSIGAPQLSAAWKDPQFDPQLRAVYYVRVIEIPTPRWTAYDAVRFNVTMPKEVKMITQERAYTSPIWYTPATQVASR
ncbi:MULTISPECIES: DUF3604 domain-containing protein [unclassified Lysobacter]|uniref:DUF3604 domain-containing protein n=1 Tax=unclassified Lysobacter TaxID=2635362 RepID=UPI001C23436E|nr:DUF3604 domain-containing protein [Lysobacter sp. MMG2]MBU8978096.1 DUF3604 domain-containing protein [Lysobacter sp. MMG2]